MHHSSIHTKFVLSKAKQANKNCKIFPSRCRVSLTQIFSRLFPLLPCQKYRIFFIYVLLLFFLPSFLPSSFILIFYSITRKRQRKRENQHFLSFLTRIFFVRGTQVWVVNKGMGSGCGEESRGEKEKDEPHIYFSSLPVCSTLFSSIFSFWTKKRNRKKGEVKAKKRDDDHDDDTKFFWCCWQEEWRQ